MAGIYDRISPEGDVDQKVAAALIITGFLARFVNLYQSGFGQTPQQIAADVATWLEREGKEPLTAEENADLGAINNKLENFNASSRETATEYLGLIRYAFEWCEFGLMTETEFRNELQIP